MLIERNAGFRNRLKRDGTPAGKEVRRESNGSSADE